MKRFYMISYDRESHWQWARLFEKRTMSHSSDSVCFILKGTFYLAPLLSELYWNARLLLKSPPWRSTPNFAIFFSLSGLTASCMSYIDTLRDKNNGETLVTKMLQNVFSLSFAIWLESSGQDSKSSLEVWELSNCWARTSERERELDFPPNCPHLLFEWSLL